MQFKLLFLVLFILLLPGNNLCALSMLLEEVSNKISIFGILKFLSSTDLENDKILSYTFFPIVQASRPEFVEVSFRTTLDPKRHIQPSLCRYKQIPLFRSLSSLAVRNL